MTNSGIYILKLKDQFRVAYIPNIENLNWSFVTMSVENKLISTRLLEHYGNSEGCGYKEIIKKAVEMKRRIHTSIKFIYYGQTWEGLLHEAQILADSEIASIQKNNDGRWDSALKNLLHIKESVCQFRGE